MIDVRSLSFSYPKQGHKAIDDLSFNLSKGKIGVLLGPNGAGKTTLIKLLLGLYRPSGGSILINGKDLWEMKAKERANLLAYVPQSLRLPPLNVFEVILSGRVKDFGFYPKEEDKSVAIESAKKLGIENLLWRNASELSGGERQKVALARALAQGSDVLLFDEPTSNLDIAARMLTLELARFLAKEGKTVLLAIHDLNDGISVGDKFLLLKEGRLLASGGKEVFTEDNLFSLYGVKSRIETVGKQKYFLWEEQK